MDTKQCYECLVNKPLTEFSVHSQMRDGHLNLCKECAKKRARVYARENPSPHKKTKWYRRLKGIYYIRYKKKHPEKYRARTLLNNAVRDGWIVRKPCRLCGNPNSQGHH